MIGVVDNIHDVDVLTATRCHIKEWEGLGASRIFNCRKRTKLIDSDAKVDRVVS